MMKLTSTFKSVIFFFLAFTVDSSFSQTGMWTWVKGDTLSRTKGVYSIQGVADLNNKPHSREGSVLWADTAGYIWMFGGMGEGVGNIAHYNDLWRYDPSTTQWTWMKGDSVPNTAGAYGVKGSPSLTAKPAARGYSYSWTDANGNFWMFGGYRYVSTGYHQYNDLWKFNPSTLEWTWMKGDSSINSPGNNGTIGVPAADNTPGCSCMGVSWSDNAGNLWLCVGLATNWGNSAVYRYNIQSNQWTYIKESGYGPVYGTTGVAAPANNPGSRQYPNGWGDSAGNGWIFGGANNGWYNDLWKFDITSHMWTFIRGDKTSINNRGYYGTQGVSTAASNPIGKAACVGWKDATGALWLYSGYRGDNTASGTFEDVWKYDIGTNRWTWVSGDSTTWGDSFFGVPGVSSAANDPGPRYFSSVVTDKFGRTWMFGGGRAVGVAALDMNDLWGYSGSTSVPLHLISFTGKSINNTERLQWTSENEYNFSHFDIERSTDGKEFKKIACERSKKNVRNNYSYDDLTPFSVEERQEMRFLYYRLKMVDKDERYSYSNVVNVKLNNQSSFTIYPNPATTSVQLRLENKMNQKVNVKLVDMSGKVVLSSTLSAGTVVANLSTTTLKAGTYLIKVSMGNGLYSEKLIIK